MINDPLVWIVGFCEISMIIFLIWSVFDLDSKPKSQPKA